ncbi:MAG: hypothetical protein ACKV19_10045 [Verrucomicrobiales bacterium]
MPPPSKLSCPPLPVEWRDCPALSTKRGPALLVGVVGEGAVDPEIEARLRAQLALIFRWMRDPRPKNEYREAGLGPPGEPEVRGLGLQRTPIVVLVSPTSDAARWVTQVVEDLAKHPEHKAGLRVVTILPYFQNLVPASNARVSQAAASNACDTVVVRLREDSGLDEAAWRAKMANEWRSGHSPLIRRRHRAALEYVAGYADLLIALTDTAPPTKTEALTHPWSGSVAHSAPHDDDPLAIVDAKRRGMTPGLLPVTSSLNWSDNGPVIHLFNPRPPMASESPTASANAPAQPAEAATAEAATGQATTAETGAVRFSHPDRGTITVLQAFDACPDGVALWDYGHWRWQAGGLALLRGVTDHLERLYHEPVPAVRSWFRSARETRLGSEANAIRGELAGMLGIEREKKDSQWNLWEWLGKAMQFPWMGWSKGKPRPGQGERTAGSRQPATLPSSLRDGLAGWEQGDVPRAEPEWLGELDATPLKAELERLAQWRRRISQWNRALDDRIKRLNRWYFRFALVGVVAIQLYENWSVVAPGSPLAPDKEPWQILSAFTAAGLLLLGWACHRLAVGRQLENRQNDTRALAEALRVQFYWTAAGAGASVASTYLVRQRGEVSWVRTALCSLSFPYEKWASDFAELKRCDQLLFLGGIYHGWVREQLGYFRKCAAQFAARQDACERGGKVLIVAGVSLLLALLVLNARPQSAASLPAWLARATLAATALWLGALLFAGPNCLFGCLTLRRRIRRVASVGRRLAIRLWHGGLDTEFSRMRRGGVARWLESARPYWWGVADRPVLGGLLPWPFSGVAGPLALGLALATVAATACLWLSGSSPISARLPEAKNLLAITRNLLLATGTLCFAWSQMRFFSENIRRYEASAALFASARRRFLHLLISLRRHHAENNTPAFAQTLAEIHSLLHALGLEALSENAEWLMMHRARPHQPVQNTA